MSVSLVSIAEVLKDVQISKILTNVSDDCNNLHINEAAEPAESPHQARAAPRLPGLLGPGHRRH